MNQGKEIKIKRWPEKAKELLADKNDIRDFLNATKALFGPSSKGAQQVRYKGVSLMKGKDVINALCKGHLDKLLNSEATG